MPLKLTSFTIRGFLGLRDLSVDFYEDVNFLIGKNGTGKTTFIKMMNHAISLEFHELTLFEFTEIEAVFRDISSDNKPTLRINKIGTPIATLDISFRLNSNENFTKYIARQTYFNIAFPRLSPQAPLKFPEYADDEAPLSRLTAFFRENLQYSWLPLLRYGSTRNSSGFDEEDGPDTFDRQDPLNNKIEDLILRSARYLSVLDFRSAAETRNFQKNYFLSLLDKEVNLQFDMDPQFHKAYSGQQRVMEDVFAELGFEESEFRSAVEAHFRRLNEAATNLLQKDEPMSIEDVVTVSNNARLKEIVERFQSYENKKAEIYAPKIRFVEIINSFFYNKTFEFSQSNEPVIHIFGSFKELSPYDISSGERQIFVILCETLLQEGRPHIFLADEPELSLHVEWQEALVRQVRKLNSQCQLIFATHSPDLVSIYQDRVISFDQI